ncbi:L-2-amino-thiazoline-4-carboxylic acid hydrolase [Dyadobacter arcticus]|uniref:L-2-amino-thiazoline-4-carboxylic acid hydrolase n=1 Tax=Dyadobacter arcticus TaxID=1078754 RepID=A0ABX0UPZ1_9BACT|nr:L-2-amino-thiazoline-4-carboxylic acid hydrolase [Dyadobacter arcticus]NIJ54194.1 hypothetical protein [Dyadobacter arcticus]
MGYRKFFTKTLEKYYPGNSDALRKEIDVRFYKIQKDVAFALTSGNPIDRRLDFTAYFLSLIQTLESKNQSFDLIKEICLEITYDYVSPKNSFQKWLKKIPARIIGLKISKIALKIFKKKIGKTGHPDGFRAEIITDKNETFGLGYGVNILECGICKLFQKHNASKYASILCEVDKLTSELAGLELIRTSTIAYGAEICDFKWKRKVSIPHRRLQNNLTRS